jgi:hypothetical protein
MKKYALIFLVLLKTVLLNGQDRVITLTQSVDTIQCKVSLITDKYIYYRNTDDTTLRKIANLLAKDVLLSTGERRKMNSRIIITNEDDWEKVLVVESYSEIEGFEKQEELTSKYSLGTKWNIGTDERMKKKAIEELKRMAAARKIPIIYIPSVYSGYAYSGTYAVVTGITYNYPPSLHIVRDEKWNKLKGAMR